MSKRCTISIVQLEKSYKNNTGLLNIQKCMFTLHIIMQNHVQSQQIESQKSIVIQFIYSYTIICYKMSEQCVKLIKTQRIASIEEKVTYWYTYCSQSKIMQKRIFVQIEVQIQIMDFRCKIDVSFQPKQWISSSKLSNFGG